MKRSTKGYSGQEVALFPTMLDVSEPSTSPSRITSSPSHSHKPSPLPEPSIEHSPAPSFEHSPDHTTAAPTQPSPIQPSPTQPSTRAEHHFPTPHDLPLHVVHSYGSDEGSLKLNDLTNLVTKLSKRIGVLEDDLRKTKKTYSSAFTKLILKVKKLEARVKIGKARKRAKVVLSEDDSSKQGRKLSDAEVQEKASTETEPFIQEVTPTEVIQDQESSEKGSAEVSTAGATKGTASEVPVVSTAEENISTAGRTVTYRRRSEEKRTRKDKGKAIMTESKPKKKSKKELEQESSGMKRKEKSYVCRQTKSTKKIDWNDPSVIRGDGGSKNYKVFSEMIEDFDRQDVEELYRLVKERYSASRPEGYDLMLWGDLHTLFEPDEEDEIWKNQHEYNVISWSLYDFCGIHILLMQNGIAIHMLTENKYPLSQEMIFKMLKKKLEVDHESSQAFELLRFIRSQVQK
ncbi:hypothetical protein Tco_1176485 [Tanacetum coccineum]